MGTLEQRLIGVLALMDSQLLVFLKGLLTTFKSALFNKGSLVWRKIKEPFTREFPQDKHIVETLYLLLAPIELLSNSRPGGFKDEHI